VILSSDKLNDNPPQRASCTHEKQIFCNVNSGCTI